MPPIRIELIVPTEIPALKAGKTSRELETCTFSSPRWGEGYEDLFFSRKTQSQLGEGLRSERFPPIPLIQLRHQLAWHRCVFVSFSPWGRRKGSIATTLSLEFVHTNVIQCPMNIIGVEWDDGNWPKCGKHGVSQMEVEHILEHAVVRVRDPDPNEKRFRTAGQTPSGRYVFVVYTYREQDIGVFIRPISARYMHEKEVKNYEQR